MLNDLHEAEERLRINQMTKRQETSPHLSEIVAFSEEKSEIDIPKFEERKI